MRKILITGGAGMLGHELKRAAPADAEIHALDRSQLDVTDHLAVKTVLRRLRPDQVIHAAAMTDVDACEHDRDRAFRVNGIGTQNVAAAAADVQAELIYVSTDYVFDGSKREPYLEHDLVHPQSVYGHSKLWGEATVRDLHARFWIVRTQWVYGRHGRNFVDTIRRAARERPELKVVDDQTGCPTWALDLARALYLILAQQPPYGIYHCSSAGSCTWFHFARTILELVGSKTPVNPWTSQELNRPAKRPTYSVLRNFCLEMTIGDPMRNWQDAVKEYLGESR
ncbi:MAG: dTDP-4-dehydrorhamnose reductase [Planctomycetota bacterium]